MDFIMTLPTSYRMNPQSTVLWTSSWHYLPVTEWTHNLLYYGLHHDITYQLQNEPTIYYTMDFIMTLPTSYRMIPQSTVLWTSSWHYLPVTEWTHNLLYYGLHHDITYQLQNDPTIYCTMDFIMTLPTSYRMNPQSTILWTSSWHYLPVTERTHNLLYPRLTL